jgi:hypothetical protein
LEVPAEDIFWNLSKFGRRIRFDVLHGCETLALEAHFQSSEEPKVTRSEIRRIRWLGVDRNDFLGHKLLHNKRNVVWFVIVMQTPLFLPLVAPFPPNCIAQAFLSSITQPPYFSDLALSAFRLFPALKIGLKVKSFATMEDIKSNATVELRKIPKEAFCRCFKQ